MSVPAHRHALAIDPGRTTGFCYATFHDNLLAITVDEAEVSLAGMFALLAKCIRDQATDEPLSIIYEDFTYRNAARTGLDLTPVKLIGVIECFREWHEPLVGFYKQSAATGKAFYSDDKLKGLGVYAKGKPHGRDATRHMMQWITFGAGSQWIDLKKVTVSMA